MAVTKKFEDLSQDEKAYFLFQKGMQAQKGGQLERAIAFYNQSIGFKPDYSDPFNNMAIAFRKLQRFEAALACYRRAIALRPDHPGTYSNMGNVLNDMDRVEEAMDAHAKAVELDPGNLLHLTNQAIVFRDAGKLPQAITVFKTVLEKDPDYLNCKWDLCLTYLMAGDWEKGFALYDARWKLERSYPRTFEKPRWQGERMEGKTLFVHREQGFGDSIQFIRLMGDVKKRFGGKVIVECKPELMRLFSDVEGIDHLVSAENPPPAFDVWIPLMSLADILDVREDTVPSEVPYLASLKENPFTVYPARNNGLNVAISWGGSPGHQNDRRRSAGLSHFIALCGYPDMNVFSLQKGEPARDLKTHAASALFIDIAQKVNDFADTACILDQMDLVITVDTSVAHLAGALGKEVWMVIPFTPDWRWMMDREDSPWYPTMRIFRQDRPGDWDSAFKKMYRALEEKLAR